MDKKVNKKLVVLPLIKNYSSRKEWEIACWRKILTSSELLNLLIAPNERYNLVLRAAALDGISSGKSYRKIGEELWLSPQTISSIKKALQEKNYRSYRERGKTDRKKKVYNSIPKRTPKKEWHEGTPRRTKYGTIYLP